MKNIMTSKQGIIGDRIIFSSKVTGSAIQNDIADIPPSDIYIMDSNGDLAERLTFHKSVTRSPHICSKGKRVVFSSMKNGYLQIFIMQIDGGNQRQLTSVKANNEHPRFDPNGEKIIFSSDRDGRSQIYSMNVDGSMQSKLIDNKLDSYTPCYSSNNSEVVYMAYDKKLREQVYIYDIKTKVNKLITENFISCIDPSFSHDGQYIIFAGKKDKKRHIWRINKETGNMENLTEKLSSDHWNFFNPVFSPLSNNYFIFISYYNNYPHIYKMKVGSPDSIENLTSNDFFPTTLYWWGQRPS